MSVQNVRHEISEGSNEMFRAIPPNGAAVGSYLCSVCGDRLAMDWLWGGYGEAMGRLNRALEPSEISYIAINRALEASEVSYIARHRPLERSERSTRDF